MLSLARENASTKAWPEADCTSSIAKGSTTVIHPGNDVTVDAYGNLHIDLQRADT